MNIQFVRLDDRVCETLNEMARQQRQTVSELVNEILKLHLEADGKIQPGATSTG